MFTLRRWASALLVGLMLAAMGGCSKVNQENYDQIETGMTRAEVEGILGEGTEQSGVAGAIGDLSGSAKVVTWGQDNQSITVTFVNDKVVAKSASGL